MIIAIVKRSIVLVFVAILSIACRSETPHADRGGALGSVSEDKEVVRISEEIEVVETHPDPPTDNSTPDSHGSDHLTVSNTPKQDPSDDDEDVAHAQVDQSSAEIVTVRRGQEPPSQGSNTSISVASDISKVVSEGDASDIDGHQAVKEKATIADVTNEVEDQLEEEQSVIDIHDAWDRLAKKYISASGVVDYAGLKQSERIIDTYLAALANNKPQSNDLSKEAKAYYINLYNAATVKLILSNYPVNSIRDLDGGEPWKKEWITLGSRKVSLNNIEHDILRPQFKDARIHFAVNCAAKSCPKIANRAFRATDLDSHLDQLTRAFINNSQVNTISANTLQLSKIFEWYQEDFGELHKFIDRYTDFTISSSATITYKEYDWGLNGR